MVLGEEKNDSIIGDVLLPIFSLVKDIYNKIDKK